MLKYTCLYINNTQILNLKERKVSQSNRAFCTCIDKSINFTSYLRILFQLLSSSTRFYNINVNREETIQMSNEIYDIKFM